MNGYTTASDITTVLFNTFRAVLRDAFENHARQFLSTNPDGLSQIPMILSWYDAGANTLAPNVGTLTVNVAGGGGGGFAAPGNQIAGGFNPQQGGFGVGGAGGLGGFQQQQIAPSFNPGNKKVARTLAELGPNALMLPTDARRGEAICGCRFKNSKISADYIFCGERATVQAVYGYLSCTDHATRASHDGSRGGGKAAGVLAVPAGQQLQVQHLGTYTGMPAAYNNQDITQTANLLSQTPSWGAQTNVSNPMTNQVIAGTQTAVSLLPVSQNNQPGNINFSATMQQPPPGTFQVGGGGPSGVGSDTNQQQVSMGGGQIQFQPQQQQFQQQPQQNIQFQVPQQQFQQPPQQQQQQQFQVPPQQQQQQFQVPPQQQQQNVQFQAPQPQFNPQQTAIPAFNPNANFNAGMNMGGQAVTTQPGSAPFMPQALPPQFSGPIAVASAVPVQPQQFQVPQQPIGIEQALNAAPQLQQQPSYMNVPASQVPSQQTNDDVFNQAMESSQQQPVQLQNQ